MVSINHGRGNKLTSFLLFVCLLQGAGLLYMGSNSLFSDSSSVRGTSDQEESRDSVNVIVATKTSFTGKITSYGKIRSSKCTDLIVPSFGNFQVLAQEVIAKSGSFIKKGDIVLRLHSKELIHKLNVAQKEYEFQKECVDKLSLAKSTLSKQEYNKADVSREKAKSEYEAMLEMMRNLEIRAPFDGVIGLIEIETGQQVRTHQKIVTIVDTKDLNIEFMLGVDEINNVKQGDFVEVKTLNKKNKCFAQIETIVPDIDPLTSKVKVRAKLENMNNPIFRHNLGVIAMINKAPINGIFIVPRSSIIDDGQSMKISIVEYSPYGHETKLVKVKVVGSLEDNFAITSDDLKEGDYIIYEGVIPRDGIPVDIKKICD